LHVLPAAPAIVLLECIGDRDWQSHDLNQAGGGADDGLKQLQDLTGDRPRRARSLGNPSLRGVQLVRKITLVIVALAMMMLVTPQGVFAGVDPAQEQLRARIAIAKQVQEKAEKAKAQEQQKLLREHMKMMQDNMQAMQAMKAKPGMTMQEHEEWIAEHQKLMDEMLGQMMKDQEMMNMHH
jgi:hypothetical protein